MIIVVFKKFFNQTSLLTLNLNSVYNQVITGKFSYFLADNEASRNDFLLLDTLIFNFLNTLMRPIQVTHVNQSFTTPIENRISTSTPINEGIN